MGEKEPCETSIRLMAVIKVLDEVTVSGEQNMIRIVSAIKELRAIAGQLNKEGGTQT